MKHAWEMQSSLGDSYILVQKSIVATSHYQASPYLLRICSLSCDNFTKGPRSHDDFYSSLPPPLDLCLPGGSMFM